MDLRTPNPDRELRGISLCAGYAGLDLGLHIAEPGFRTVAYVEREAHAVATLAARMEDQALAAAPVWDDLRTFDGRVWRGKVHILSAGYPCQPFSSAGKRRGADDPRHLWPEVARIARELEPEWIFCENVEGHINLGLAEVGEELRAMGYAPKAGIFTAAEVGANHRRRRIFILAHADRHGRGLLPVAGGGGGAVAGGEARGDHRDQRRAVLGRERGAGLDRLLAGDQGAGPASGGGAIGLPGPNDLRSWEELLDRRPDLQPAILRGADGLADRVERTRGAGNGVCSLAAAIAWRTLKAAHLADLA